jgi:hypothetical protein
MNFRQQQVNKICFSCPTMSHSKNVSPCLLKTEYVTSFNTPHTVPVLDDKMSGPDDKAMLLRKAEKKSSVCIRFYMKATKGIFFSEVNSLTVLKTYNIMSE